MRGSALKMSRRNIEHYARLRSGERPTPRREFGRGGCRVALVYPNTYHVGMSNLGFHTVYGIVNSSRRLLCDRFFSLEWASASPPLSLECERPLLDFDVIAFSVAFENDYLNVLKTLNMARIPVRSAERDDSHPLIVLGGAVTFINPEPVADFVDVIVMGEAEYSTAGLFEMVALSRGAPRSELVAAAAGMDGVYVPALSADGPPPIRAWAPTSVRKTRIPAELVAHSAIIARDTEFADTLLVEISRGCPYRCRFCAVGHCFPAFRSASAEDVLELVAGALAPGRLRPPARRVGLVSSAVGDHPELDELCVGLRSMGIEIRVSSLRADRLSDVMLQSLSESGTRTVTIAPEAGSERLRLIAGKHITEEAVVEGAARSVACGIPNVRLYFIVGFPTETDEDIAALMDLATRVRKAMDNAAGSGPAGPAASASARSGGPGTPGASILARRAGRGPMRPRGRDFGCPSRPAHSKSIGATAGSLTVSLSPFVPKPSTPLQWSPMADFGAMRRKLSMIRRGLSKLRGVRVTSETMRAAYLQGILSRGGRDLASFLEAASESGDWKQAAVETGLDLEEVLGERGINDTLPWSTMLGENRMARLRRECRAALSWIKE